MSAPKGKEKLAVWMYPEIKAKVKEMYRQDDCRSMSEFVEKSIRFYVGYLTAENKTNYLPNMFLSCLRSIIRESDNRHSVINLSKYDPASVERLRYQCQEEVKEIHGMLHFEDAIDWQEGWEN